MVRMADLPEYSEMSILKGEEIVWVRFSSVLLLNSYETQPNYSHEIKIMKSEQSNDKNLAPLTFPMTERQDLGRLFYLISLIAIAGWIVFGLAMFISFARSYNQDRSAYQERLDTNLVTQATVTERQGWGGENEAWYVTFQFDAPGPGGEGERFSRTEKVGRKTYQSLAQGDSVTVLYPPAAPNDARLQSELHPPSLVSVGAAGLFLIAGFFMLGGVWWMKKGSEQKARENKDWQRAFFGSDAAPGDYDKGREAQARATNSALCCEKCGRTLGPEVVNCPDRAWGACPYQVELPLEQASSKQNRGCLFLGLAVTLIGLALLPFFFPLALCVVASGALLIVLNRLPLAGQSSALILYNKASGQMWQRYSLFNFTLRQTTTTALLPVTLEDELRRPLHYPASISALYQRQDANTILYMALLSLVCQGAITLEHTLVSDMFFQIPLKMRRGFALSPGAQIHVEGELERRIVHTVRDWAGRQDPEIKLGSAHHRRTFTHFLALEDLIFLIIGERGSPDKWLAVQLVGADASQQGLGRVKGRLHKRFEPVPEYQARLQAEYEIMQQVHEKFNAAQPAVASGLWRAIERAIRMCVPTGD